MKTISFPQVRGQYTLLSRLGRNSGGNPVYLCRHICGKVVEKRGDKILQGHTGCPYSGKFGRSYAMTFRRTSLVEDMDKRFNV